MPMRRKVLTLLLLASGEGILLWMAFRYLILAFVAGQFIPGVGTVLWLLGFVRTLASLPGIAGIAFLTAGLVLRRR